MERLRIFEAESASFNAAEIFIGIEIILDY
jgi:hypothetical protein